MGFQPLGVYGNVGYKLGAWHDVGWWQLALKPPQASPQKPVALRELQNHPEWHSLLLRGVRAIRTEVGGRR